MLTLALTACTSGGFGLVPSYPYVEDRSLALVDETLTLRVREDRTVRVEALFEFVAVGSPKSRVATFPIGGPRGTAHGFLAELAGAEPERLPVALGTGGALPFGDPVESWDIWLDGDALARHDGRLRVTYEQRGSGRFSYVLKSGAYWCGPIARLEVVIDDPHRNLLAVIVEGERAEVRGRSRLRHVLRDVEPRSGVELLFE
ncbi:MAG: hypothetical protein KF718_01350 [Polyangiaceae bacterium]|nr:hypothetical protein [Polyangiaceae bacterium]